MTAPASNPADPLAALKDIHLPPPVSLWPPAPGWWILALLVVLLLVIGVWKFVQRRRHRAYRRAALRVVETVESQWQQHRDDEQLQAQINRLLKQVALAAYPRAQVAALHGDPWLQFLDAHLRKPVFTQPTLRGFGALYGANANPVAPTELLHAARAWIRGHRC